MSERGGPMLVFVPGTLCTPSVVDPTARRLGDDVVADAVRELLAITTGR